MSSLNKKYIKLLKTQIQNLEIKEFDLEAWKSGATAALTRVFGADDPRIGQIEGLKIDYSSWALRDSGANYKPLETCRRKGRAILENAVEELELFGPSSKGQTDLAAYFSPEDLKTLQSEDAGDKDKRKVVGKLKKGELEELILQYLSRPTETS